MWEMIKNEWKNIGRNRVLLMSVIAISFIPLMYSVFFLKSVWNPYGNTQDLPIAVVNKDQAVQYDGQTLNVGQQTVDKLKKNHSMGWKFVSAAQAKKGLKDRKYYTVVTIPKDFSKDAASVLNQHPQKMKLSYETNDSLNYIAEVMSSVAMSKVDKQIRASVTNAYASTMLNEVKTLGKGLKSASTGAVQLDTGLATLTDGVNQYTVAVSTVNDGVQTLKVSVAPLASAGSQLASGSTTLANGVSQYTAGVSSVNSGAGQIAAGTNTLKSETSSQLSALTSSSLFALLKNPTAITSLANQSQSISDTLNSPNTTEALTALNQLANIDTNALSAQLTSLQSTLTTANQNVTTQLTLIGGNAYVSAADAQAVLAANPNLDQTSKDKLNDIVTRQGNISSALTSTKTSLTEINSQLSNLTGTLNSLEPTLTKAASMKTQLQQLETTLTNAKSLLTSTNSLMSGLSDPSTQSMLANLPAQLTNLQSGIDQLNTGAQQLYAGTTQLNNNSSTLNSGANTLASSLGQLNAKLPSLITGVNQLADGTSQLNGKSSELTSGAAKLSSGSGTLATALKSGSKTVNGIHTSKATAEMFANPTKLSNHKYSHVPNYGHALAPYVLSVALYVGAIVFNVIYPIKSISSRRKSATAWFVSKISVASAAAIAAAVIEAALMLVFGLHADHVGAYFLTAIVFSLTSMYIVMFLSTAFDNPGRLLAMILLMFQLGGSGGTFPMEVTNHFYNVVHPFLPMSYSILGLRQGLTSGLGTAITGQTTGILCIFAVGALILLWLSMNWIKLRHPEILTFQDEELTGLDSDEETE